jgi:arsenate reductase
MAEELLFVCHPRCTTCKKARAWLDERGIGYVERDITKDNPTYDELSAWWKESGLPLRRLFNTSGNSYRGGGWKQKLDAGISDEEALTALSEDGMLVKRPVLVGKGFATFGFKAAEWADLLGVAE